MRATVLIVHALLAAVARWTEAVTAACEGCIRWRPEEKLKETPSLYGAKPDCKQGGTGELIRGRGFHYDFGTGLKSIEGESRIKTSAGLLGI